VSSCLIWYWTEQSTNGNSTTLGFTDAETWQDTNDNGAYDPGTDLTGNFTMIASYDQGCGRVLAVGDNSF
jgi:predicted heme/steroid binding protein